MDIQIWHIVILGFVNAFGYLLPTLYILKKGYMGVFEYLFQSIYIDLVFTSILSVSVLRRIEYETPKLILPIILCIFGVGFHYTAIATTSGNLKFLSFTFTQSYSALTAPSV